MKTFTTYAEKKAKQFLNLLQGYTKGIRFTAILILLLMGVSNALGKDIYFKPSENWKEANAWFQVWDGQHNHNFESTGIAGLYKATIEDDKTSIWIKRKQPNTDNDWDGGSETQISTYNYFYNSNWSNSMSRSNIIGTVRGGKIYFDNSKTKWTGNIQFVIGHDSYSRTYSMSQLKNTDLWYVNLDAATYREWGDAKYYAVISTTNKVTDGAWGSTSLSTKAPSYRTTIYNGPFSLDYGSSYLVTPSSESPTASSITISYVSTYSSLNSQQTIKSTVNDADANSKATISITSYKMTGNGQVTEQTATLGTGANASYIDAARTATTTLEVGDVATGYQFDGWYTAATGGTELSREKKYIYYPTAATTVYARFSTKQHTVKFAVHSSGHGSLTAKVGNTSISSGDKVNYGSTIEFTAKPDEGYQIEGWYKDSNCTTSLGNGTNNTYSVTVTTGTNVYVKFVEIPVNSHNITYTAQGTGWTYGNSNPTTAEEGATVTFVVNPTAGYRVSVSSDGPTLTGPNANNQYTFTMPTKDVKITVDAKPEQYTITLNDNGGSDGSGTVTATYLAAMPNITAPIRTGYTFNGYFDAASGGTKYYNADGSSAKNWDKTSNTTLYAQWTANKYTVTFNENGGTGTMSNQSFEYDVEKALTANAFTRKGYTFLGWAKSSSATTATYTDKQKVKNLTATNNSTVNLYAVWQALPPTPVILKPNDEWKQANARYAIYYWGDGTDNIGWVEMTDLGCSGEYFTGEVPASYLDFKFVRLDPSGKDDASKNNGLHWDYKWNETGNLTTPAANKNLYDMTLKTHLYLDPGVWNVDNAWFAAYFFGNGETWKKMTNVDGLFACEIPTNYPKVIFVRKNPSNQELNFNDKWAQTGDLTIPTDDKNKFSISGWDNNGSWSAIDDNIHDNSKWTTYTVPTYTININAPEGGSIAVTVGGNTTTVTNTPKQITNIAAGTTFNIAYTPNAGFELGHSEVYGIKETYDGAGTYTVCGPVDITAHFVTEEDQVVYLRPNGTWLSDKAIFYAYVFNRYGVNEWIELVTEETDYTGAYGCTIPAGYSDVIFVRINPTAAEPSWNDNVKWNQSVDYVIPVNTTNNRFIIGEKITAEGADKDKYQGSWEASNTPIYGIPGDWQGTETWAADQYPLMGPDGLVTVNITQTDDTLGFKVYHYPYGSDNNSAQWLGNNGTMVRGGEGVHEGGWTMETNKNNCGLGVDIAGDYVFAFNIRDKKLTVAYPALPTPAIRITSEERVYEDLTGLSWVGGAGLEDKPYQLYADEAARITVSPLPEVEGLTAYYQFGENPEQDSNVFDWKGISTTTATAITIKAYYKNSNGATSEPSTATTSFFQAIKLPFNLMSDPRNEINVDRIAAGDNILVQFRSDSKATVTLSVTDLKTETTTVLKNIENSMFYDYTYDVPDNTTPRILRFTAKAASPVNGRYLECSADVAIYKNVIIKVKDPEGWVKNVFMWRNYSDAVKTEWPGEPVLQNFGIWRVFSVKYPAYDRFIVNEGIMDGKQTVDWILPEDDTCYELLDPANNGSDKEEDKHKYGLKVADCPGNLIVSDIKDTTIMEGEQIVVMPEIFVGLGYKLSDVRITQLIANNPSSVRVDISSTNIVVRGYAIGESNVSVTYTLGNETITNTFKVTVVKNTNITIQVKVPDFGDGADYQWKDGTKIGIRYWGEGINGTDLLMDYAYKDNTYTYAQAQIPLGTNGIINFHFYYERHGDDNAKWRQTINIENVSTSGCYKLKQGNDYYRHWDLDGEYCYDDTNYAQYQVKVFLPIAGKEYSSNVVTNTIDTLSFFAPGQNETGYRSGTVQLYKNGKMIAAIAPSTFTESNVYTAIVNETGDGLDSVGIYDGNYYIRTYGTSHKNVGFNNGKGWNSIKDLTAVEKDSVRFTYFIPRENEFYNHYWVQAMNTGEQFEGKDVSACVANEYNDDLAGKLTKGKGTNEDGDIKVGKGKFINVRFGYDPRTNYFGRAIIKGSEYDNFLNIHCDNAYKDKNCSTKLPYGTSGLDNKMQDISNWVYQRDFYVPIDNSHPSALLYVEATSPSTEMNVTDHLLGYVTNEVTGEEDHTKPVQRTIIGSGTDNGTYLMRVVYDFKTNRIIAAWLPQGTVDVTDPLTLHSDVLFVRKENEEVPQINLSKNGEIRSLESMFFAIELERGDKNAANRHEEQYLFTLPFNSVVGSISGIPGYLKTWGIQRYRGDLRAKHGLFLETPTYWQWMSITDTLYAGEGYLLVFDKKSAPWEEIEVDKYDNEGHITGEKEKISIMRLYFPSTTSGFDLQQQSTANLIRTYEDHTCTIELHDRYKYDSNWKVIGTTSYNNAGVTEATKENEDYVDKYEERIGFPSFRYKYSYTMSNDNRTFTYKYTPEDGKTSTYKSFFGYMVQFAGTIEWQPVMSETVPEGIAARRYVAEGERTSYTTRLEFANAAGEKQDQTFVAVDENGTIGFDQNKDLNKVLNAGTNIYTLAEDVPYAGNTLAMEKQTVPVGIVVAEAGEYTFRMPDGTDGISVTLVDNVTGTHTDMLMDEYTITLDAGTIENRFYLIVDPDRAATSVENVGTGANGEEAKGVEKFLIDGKLFIRTADGIFDAKGQRL